jgi:hypothetical protein
MQQNDLCKSYQVQGDSANSYSNLFEQFQGWSAANTQQHTSYGLQILTYLPMAGTFSILNAHCCPCSYYPQHFMHF